MNFSRTVMFSILILFCATSCECYEQNEIEPRGKKKKIALFVYLADLLVKKVFVLKLIYAFVFWVVVHKAGYFLAWFASYLKEKKHHEHQYQHYGYYPQPQYGYGPYKRS